MKLKILRNNEGSVLIIALIILVVLAFAASTSLMNSITNVKIGKNYANSMDVFNLSELGLAKAKLIVKNTSDFDILLNPATYPSGVLIPTTSEGDGTYTVKIANNTTGTYADSGGATNDTDSIVVLTSTAYGRSGNKVEIETYIGRPTSIQFPSSPLGGGGGAAGLCGVGPNVDLGGSSKVDGYDYDVPANFSCSGSGCDGSKKADQSQATYGIVLDSSANADDRITRSDENRIDGCANPPTCTTTGKWIVNSALDCTSWQNLSNQLAALGAGPNVQIITANSISSGTLGTRTNPQITIINTSSPTFTISGTVDGAGVIVVASNTSVTTLGTFHYEGVMIILGDNASFAVSGGSVDFFGYMIVNSSIIDIQPELSNSGSSKIKWSTAAMGTAQQAIDGASGGGGGGSQLVTYSWSERY